MRSKIAIGGHPIHPMLVPLPIGLFVWALVADVVYLFTGSLTWYDISFWSGIGGIATALIAAVAGFGDYLSLGFRGRTLAMATTHMLLNLAVVALFFGAMLLMLDRNAVEGTALTLVVALHAVGVGMLAVSGWLGGELVYRYRVGMMTSREVGAEAEEETGR